MHDKFVYDSIQNVEVFSGSIDDGGLKDVDWEAWNFFLVVSKNIILIRVAKVSFKNFNNNKQ